MPATDDLLKKPADLVENQQFETWFRALGNRLLNGFDFLVKGIAYRLVELEFYYHGPGHLDPFSHRNPLQQRTGFWCFHRMRTQYRGGTFKGLDISFGSGQEFGGILIRSIIGGDGKIINGPSLCVDHLLKRTRSANIAALDKSIADRSVFDEASVLCLRQAPIKRAAVVHASARVGLTLHRARGFPEMPHYQMRPYRYLTEPRLVVKGKGLLVRELLLGGMSVDAIHDLTGSPRKSIEQYRG